MVGWIAVSRKLWKHDFFKDSPMSEREAWLWMLSQAAYADTTHRVAGEVIPVPRGSFMITLRELQSTFMWASDTRVRNFLKRLKDERMVRWEIVGRKNAPKTHVTICKYGEYQSPERTTERTEKRTENAPSGTVNKQDNNITTLPNGSDAVGVDFTKEVFDRGVAFLSKYGTPDKKARSLIGMWRKNSGDDALFSALRDANREGVTEPVAWITARLKPKTPENFVPDFDLSDFEEEVRQ